MNSREVLWEIQTTERLSKRIVPVILRPVTEEVPASIARLNYLDLTDPAAFEDGIAKLRATVEALGEVDMAFAKARYADALRATEPELNDEVSLNLVEARHPLLSGRVGTEVPFIMRTPSGLLTEYPLPTARWFVRNVPVGGGGYFRLYPYAVTRRALRAINMAGRPFAVYLHPWEFDPDQPRLAGPRVKQFKHRVNLRRTRPRLEQLLREFRFDTMSASLGEWFGARPRLAVAA